MLQGLHTGSGQNADFSTDIMRKTGSVPNGNFAHALPEQDVTRRFKNLF